jgi:hypothetical protein
VTAKRVNVAGKGGKGEGKGGKGDYSTFGKGKGDAGKGAWWFRGCLPGGRCVGVCFCSRELKSHDARCTLLLLLLAQAKAARETAKAAKAKGARVARAAVC